ncbi:MAG TPA: glycosyltransferase family 9 protein, partial [Miltoncostaea sp.]|nr:glycosyltransferase family 9 protein [Miltoncostaea sp.]
GFPLPEGDDGALRVTADDEDPPDLPEGYVVVHPGASVPARAWPAERHAALVEALAPSVPVVVTGGPGERGLTRRVAGSTPGALDLGGRTTLGGLARVLEGARALVVGNTGPAHLAAAVGCPVVWVHAPTVPAVRWRPWRVPHAVVARDVPCAGCRARVCPVPGHPCMTDIGVAEVLGALGGLMARTRAPAAAGVAA